MIRTSATTPATTKSWRAAMRSPSIFGLGSFSVTFLNTGISILGRSTWLRLRRVIN
jgi:hypothetical protein